MTETMIAPRPRFDSVDGVQDVSRRATVSVLIEAADPITRAGIASQLRRCKDIEVLRQHDAQARVALLVVEAVDEVATRRIRLLHLRGASIVLVVGRPDPRAIMGVLDHGVRAVLTRYDLNADRLVAVLRNVSVGGLDLPPVVLRQLIEHVAVARRAATSSRPGLHVAELTPRERDVLSLMADGLSTREVATRLSYSERTIKNVLQDLTTRLHLRNRTQAVAFALRNGWI